MESFCVTEKGILGNAKDLKALAQKEEATILVVSDSHKNIENLKKVLEEFGPSCDAVIFCGDGAYDLGYCLDQAFQKKLLLPPVAVLVRGNGDPSYISTDFPPHTLDVPESAVLEAAGKKIFISHGHLQGVYYNDSIISEEARKMGCKIIVHGHTHIARQTYTDRGMHIICPGSVSLPRGGTEKSFALLTIKGSYIDAAFKEIKMTGFESFNPVW